MVNNDMYRKDRASMGFGQRNQPAPAKPKILRVFPRRTVATPNDELAIVGGPTLFSTKYDEIHISVTFSWDMAAAELLARAWEQYGPVTMGGPATGMKSGNFNPGQYVKEGYVITSRGCHNRCWFCNVWRREGLVRELPITYGWNVLDDNLLACSDNHVKAVFDMLHKAKANGQPVQFTGGLEAAILTESHVELLANLKPKQLFMAYDTPDDYEPLVRAGRLLQEAGLSVAGHALRCYVLIGWPKDTLEAAERRLYETMAAGFMPMAMLYRGADGSIPAGWRGFQRQWARPAIMSKLYAAHNLNNLQVQQTKPKEQENVRK